LKNAVNPGKFSSLEDRLELRGKKGKMGWHSGNPGLDVIEKGVTEGRRSGKSKGRENKRRLGAVRKSLRACLRVLERKKSELYLEKKLDQEEHSDLETRKGETW